MSDDIQFGAESYQSMDSWSATSESQTSANTSFLNGAACSNGDCENKENPAEEAWVKLVSAIPVADQVQNLKCVAQGTAAPSPEEVQSLVSDIRPSNPNNYALREIANKWNEFNHIFSDIPDTAVAPILRSKLSELSAGWQGGDFDAFAEQMEIVFANCEQIATDIGTDETGMVGLLNQKADELYALQGAGSGELPYPAPQYWVEDKGGLFSNPKVHVRAPFKPGDCEVAEGCMFGDGDAEQAMELGGFDSEYTGELNQYMTDQTEYHYARLKGEQLQASEAAKPDDSTEDVKLTPEQETAIRAEAERLATEDANTRAAEDYEAADQDYQARATEQNETVVARWNDAESSASSFSPTVETSRDTTFRDSADDLDNAAYSPPSGGNFNTDLSSSGTSGLNSPSNTSTFGSGGNLTGGSNTGTDTGVNPWESSTDDDDETSGGLASGGGLGAGTLPGTGLGTGAGTGMGAGGGGGLGPGSGLFGPAAGGGGGMSGMTGAGAGGRGAGAGGMGKGQGLFGKTAGAGAGGKAGAGGMMGGGRGANGLGDDEEANTGTWLTEDEDVWGLARFNDENDPLA